MKSDALVIVFARTPLLGLVKTRLAAHIGQAAALSIYKDLLKHTAQCLKTISCDQWIAYTPSFPEQDPLDAPNAILRLQVGQSLGKRMENAFAEAFENGYQRVLMIGSDCFNLTSHHIQSALAALRHTDCVFGPAQDGGYYLIGLRRLIPTLFQRMRWSTPSVLRVSLRRLQRLQTPYVLLDTLNDLDTIQDMPPSWRKRYPLQDSQGSSVEQDDV